MAILTGSAVQYGTPLYNQYGDQTETNAIQNNVNAIVKIRFGSGSTVDQTTGTGDGSSGIISGTEVSMGVPQKGTNWYRIFYQTVADDNDGNISGMGIRIERWTTTSGWNQVLAQGSHASYDNNYTDWYRTNHGIFWVPVHQSYQAEEHRFRIGFHKHDNGQIRFNSSIGSDLRRNGWNNNIMEVWEVDSTRIHTTGTLTSY